MEGDINVLSVQTIKWWFVSLGRKDCGAVGTTQIQHVYVLGQPMACPALIDPAAFWYSSPTTRHLYKSCRYKWMQNVPLGQWESPTWLGITIGSGWGRFLKFGVTIIVTVWESKTMFRNGLTVLKMLSPSNLRRKKCFKYITPKKKEVKCDIVLVKIRDLVGKSLCRDCMLGS